MFIVMEIQKSGDAAADVAKIVTVHETKNEAESKFHTILASAAVSSVREHSAVMLTDTGIWLRAESYEHPVVAPPEPEPEIDSENE